jgi:hypothetical protein
VIGIDRFKPPLEKEDKVYYECDSCGLEIYRNYEYYKFYDDGQLTIIHDHCLSQWAVDAFNMQMKIAGEDE